jgi:hypothetical protein
MRHMYVHVLALSVHGCTYTGVCIHLCVCLMVFKFCCMCRRVCMHVCGYTHIVRAMCVSAPCNAYTAAHTRYSCVCVRACVRACLWKHRLCLNLCAYVMTFSVCLLKPGLCLQCACASRHTGACMSVRCKCLKVVEIVGNFQLPVARMRVCSVLVVCVHKLMLLWLLPECSNNYIY